MAENDGRKRKSPATPLEDAKMKQKGARKGKAPATSHEDPKMKRNDGTNRKSPALLDLNVEASPPPPQAVLGPTISGQVVCQNCRVQQKRELLDTQEKLKQLTEFMETNKEMMRGRAPMHWLRPVWDISCTRCKSYQTKPAMPERNEDISWFFLLLTQMLGVCTVKQLKYLWERSGSRCTGAKDHVLYRAYEALCKEFEERYLQDSL